MPNKENKSIEEKIKDKLYEKFGRVYRRMGSTGPTEMEAYLDITGSVLVFIHEIAQEAERKGYKEGKESRQEEIDHLRSEAYGESIS